MSEIRYCTEIICIRLYSTMTSYSQIMPIPSAFHLLPELCALPLKLLPQVIETPAQQAGSREICGDLCCTTPGFAPRIGSVVYNHV